MSGDSIQAPNAEITKIQIPKVSQVRAGKLSQLVVEQFKSLLRSGDINPGDRLPPERELADMFGVGRNSVREALRELEILGVVERQRGRGTHVRQIGANDTLAPLKSVISLAGTQVDEVLEFRRSFEPEVAALAAQKVTTSSVLFLKRAFQEYDQAHHPSTGRASTGQTLRADTNFHRSIALATGNPIMAAVHDALDELLVNFRSHLAPEGPEQVNRVAEGHERILNAILAGDSAAAREAMLDHLDTLHAVIGRAPSA